MIQSRCFCSCFIIYFILLVHANEIWYFCFCERLFYFLSWNLKSRDQNHLGLLTAICSFLFLVLVSLNLIYLHGISNLTFAFYWSCVLKSDMQQIDSLIPGNELWSFCLCVWAGICCPEKMLIKFHWICNVLGSIHFKGRNPHFLPNLLRSFMVRA